MNIEHTITEIKRITPIVKSDKGNVIESNEANKTISSILFEIRALKHWTTLSLLTCTELSKAKIERAKEYLMQTLDTAAEIVCEKMKYVECNEKAITDSDIDSQLHLQPEKYIHLAESKGWIIHVDLFNPKNKTRTEYYCMPDDVEYDSYSGMYYKDLELKTMPKTLTENEVLDYIKDELIDEIICDATEVYAGKNSIAADMIFEIRTLQNQISRPVSQEYKTRFLHQVEQCTTVPKRLTKDLTTFFTYTNMDKLKTVLNPILKEKKGKDIAVTLRALGQLNLINLDKVNRCDLYATLRAEMNISSSDQGINFCLSSTNDTMKRCEEIKKEVEILKKALEI